MQAFRRRSAGSAGTRRERPFRCAVTKGASAARARTASTAMLEAKTMGAGDGEYSTEPCREDPDPAAQSLRRPGRAELWLLALLPSGRSFLWPRDPPLAAALLRRGPALLRHGAARLARP